MLREAHTPGDDTLRFLRVGRTQVCDLRCLKLCQLRFPAQDPKNIRDEHTCILSDTVPWSKVVLLSDSRRRIGGVELCKSLDVFEGFVIYSKGDERKDRIGMGGVHDTGGR